MIGGGLLGLEAARGLITHGCEVHVVHLAKYLMEQQFDPRRRHAEAQHGGHGRPCASGEIDDDRAG